MEFRVKVAVGRGGEIILGDLRWGEFRVFYRKRGLLYVGEESGDSKVTGDDVINNEARKSG